MNEVTVRYYKIITILKSSYIAETQAFFYFVIVVESVIDLACRCFGQNTLFLVYLRISRIGGVSSCFAGISPESRVNLSPEKFFCCFKRF